MIYVTGDTHGTLDASKLFPGAFPDGRLLIRKDYVIIAGDFGGIWYGSERDEENLEFFEDKKYTVLFVDGNHENFEALNRYPVTVWNGGKVHRIRENIIHLMRGQVFTLEGKTFFTFGGGLSVDKHRRTPYVDWWPEEEPSKEETEEALSNLEKAGNQVDYMITHAAPERFVRNELNKIHTLMGKDCPTEKFLDYLYDNVQFKMWFCGHYHMDVWLHKQKLQVLYHNIIKIAPGYPVASRYF